MADVRRSVVFSAPPDEEHRPDSLHRVAWVCAGLAGLLAVLDLTGWATGLTALSRVLPGFVPMVVNTAGALLLLAVAAFVPRRAACVLAVLAGLLAAAELAEYAIGRSLGIDQLIFADPFDDIDPGRMSVATATLLLLLAVARILPTARRRRATQAIGVLVLLTAVLVILAYLYDVDSLYYLGPVTEIALPTAVAIALLAAACLAGVPDGALRWISLGRDAGATMMRRLLPVTLVGLPVLGVLCLGVEHLHWTDAPSAIALFVVLCGLLVGATTWVAGIRLMRVDQRREQALADLRDLKGTLERQVQERAAQVQLRRDEIAVLQDRQRIAADLHDIVIQRLFAAGMFLQGASVTDPDTRRRLESAVEAMDGAIRDLRQSIFELGSRGGVDELANAIDEVCVDASRVLGFRPEVTVDDPDLEAETVREDVLAVLREALANVARHAQASAVEVTLRSGHGLISLTVSDDGTGMSEAPHSSGTRNMARRARERGGDCVWTQVEPHGTRLWWYVPGVPAAVDELTVDGFMPDGLGLDELTAGALSTGESAAPPGSWREPVSLGDA